MGRKAKASDDVVYWNEYGLVQAMEKHPAGKAKETPAHLKFMDGDSPKQTEYTQGFYKGAIYERKRIITLLETERKRHKGEGLLTAAVYLKDLITLIKGENK